MNKNELKIFISRYWIILSISLITVALIILYLITFDGGLSKDHSKWGEFGNFFGALTGMLAFIGVIITLIQSRRQVLTSEERETFFSLLDIFREHRNNVKIEKAELVNDPFIKKRKVLPNDFANGETAFKQLADESNFFFLEAILKNAPDNITEEEMLTLIPPEESTVDTSNQEYDEKIKSLYRKYKTLSESKSSFSIINFMISRKMAFQIIQYYVREKKYDLLSYAMMSAGDIMYSLYKNQLGPYHRNTFYLYDIITKFKETNNYGLLFRAQLSKDELIVIFFNSFSIESNPTARKYYLDGFLFNNLAWKDVWISRPSYYIDNRLLGELYEAADQWFKQDRELKRKLSKIE